MGGAAEGERGGAINIKRAAGKMGGAASERSVTGVGCS